MKQHPKRATFLTEWEAMGALRLSEEARIEKYGDYDYYVAWNPQTNAPEKWQPSETADLLAKAYHEYNTWIGLMMKMLFVLALIGMIFSILVCASFKNEHPYRWYYLGALALDVTLWTIILLIDRHKMLKISKLQRIESERLNT